MLVSIIWDIIRVFGVLEVHRLQHMDIQELYIFGIALWKEETNL